MTRPETPAFQTRPVTVAGRRGIELSTQGFTFTVQSGPDLGAELRLSGPAITVGTEDTCELVLTDITASRRHVLFKLSREGIVAEDLGSTNGTWLAGVRIRSALVPDGSLIRLRPCAIGSRISRCWSSTSFRSSPSGTGCRWSPRRPARCALFPRTGGPETCAISGR